MIVPYSKQGNRRRMLSFALLCFLILLDFIQSAAGLVTDPCGGSHVGLTALESPQYFVSPGFPIGYTDLLTCRWVINVTQEYQVVRLHVVTSKLKSSAICNEDYVEVKDGHKKWDRVIKSWCGNRIPPDITSSGHYMTITFKSNADGEVSEGFNMTYQAVTKGKTIFLEPEYTAVNFVLWGLFALLMGVIGSTTIFIALVRTHKKVKKKKIQNQKVESPYQAVFERVPSSVKRSQYSKMEESNTMSSNISSKTASTKSHATTPL